ncbi:MAG: RDD family protein [Thiotrichaceae bacterium]
MMNDTSISSKNPSPPMHRRLIAMFYDFAIAGTLATIVAGIMSYLLEKKGLTIEPDSGLTYSIFAMELLVGFLYYQWFCTHRGQTLGMSAWKIRITNLSGQHVTYTQILIRYIALLVIMLAGFLLAYKVLTYSSVASIGIGVLFLAGALIYSYFNQNKLALHEMISRTQLIDLRQ